MSQKLPVGSFDWVEKTSQFTKISQKAIITIVM